MENNYIKPNNGLGLGIAGLVLGIVAIFMALIPCVSMLGLVLGILGVALSTVGYSQAKKVNTQHNLIMAALVVSIIGTGFSILKLTDSIVKLNRFPWENIGAHIEKNIEKNSDDFGKAFEEEFEKELGGSLEDVLKNLEDDLDDLDDSLDDLNKEMEDSFNKLTDEEKARKLGKAAGRALKGFMGELADSAKIEITIETD